MVGNKPLNINFMGGTWRRVSSNRAKTKFLTNHKVLIAEFRGQDMSNDNWLITSRSREAEWGEGRHFKTNRFGQACHIVRDRETEGTTHYFIEGGSYGK